MPPPVKHVLIVAFHYPPESSSSGVLRTVKFSRYLADYGWRATVLTINVAAYSVTDASLLQQIPENVNVIRTRFIELRKVISIAGKYPAILITPDAWLGWYPFAVSAGKALARRDKVDAVFSTSPHATSHLIAQRIAKSQGLPSIIDFRDPWYEIPPEPGTPAIVHWFAKHLERRVVARATRVVASTTSLRNELCARYSNQSAEKFSAILNGYDDADFAALHEPSAAAREPRLVVLHAGSINLQFRDPRPLFAALGRLIKSGTIAREKILIRFLGPGDYAESSEISTCIADAELAGIVEFLPRVDYRQGLSQMAKADLLLLLQASDDTATLVPAKLYEYLRARVPVLALVRAGATNDVLNATGGGWCCDPRNSSPLEAHLGNIFQLWSAGQLASHAADPARLAGFDRRVLTGQLASILDATCAR